MKSFVNVEELVSVQLDQAHSRIHGQFAECVHVFEAVRLDDCL